MCSIQFNFIDNCCSIFTSQELHHLYRYTNIITYKDLNTARSMSYNLSRWIYIGVYFVLDISLFLLFLKKLAIPWDNDVQSQKSKVWQVLSLTSYRSRRRKNLSLPQKSFFCDLLWEMKWIVWQKLCWVGKRRKPWAFSNWKPKLGGSGKNFP